MSLEKFGEELKQARLETGVSLTDISVETRINQKFLEAIENGKFQILPQTYVRAFLREYALMVNLDPVEIMDRYELALQESSPSKPEESVSKYYSLTNKGVSKKPESETERFSSLQRNLFIGIILIIVVAAIIILTYFSREKESVKPLSELPFDRVVQENEAASFQFQSNIADSTPVVITPQMDSLRLEITTIDSVWINLLIDGKKGADYLFGPKKKRTWSAKERFSITMGNAGGATFRLNNTELGPLGKRGAVIRNTIITEANLNN